LKILYRFSSKKWIRNRQPIPEQRPPNTAGKQRLKGGKAKSGIGRFSILYKNFGRELKRAGHPRLCLCRFPVWAVPLKAILDHGRLIGIQRVPFPTFPKIPADMKQDGIPPPLIQGPASCTPPSNFPLKKNVPNRKTYLPDFRTDGTPFSFF